MIFQSMLTLQKRFCLIDSPIPFQLVCNPMGTYDLRDENNQFIGDRTNIDGTDICGRPAGAWLFDIWKLLPEKYMKENPAFKMAICYDDSALSEGQEVKISYSDVDLGEGVAGVNGQDVQDLITHELLSSIDSTVESVGNIVSDLNPYVSATGNSTSRVKEVINALIRGQLSDKIFFPTVTVGHDVNYFKAVSYRSPTVMMYRGFLQCIPSDDDGFELIGTFAYIATTIIGEYYLIPLEIVSKTSFREQFMYLHRSGSSLKAHYTYLNPNNNIVSYEWDVATLRFFGHEKVCNTSVW